MPCIVNLFPEKRIPEHFNNRIAAASKSGMYVVFPELYEGNTFSLSLIRVKVSSE